MEPTTILMLILMWILIIVYVIWLGSSLPTFNTTWKDEFIVVFAGIVITFGTLLINYIKTNITDPKFITGVIIFGGLGFILVDKLQQIRK
jgi:uncharacterized membrane protein